MQNAADTQPQIKALHPRISLPVRANSNSAFLTSQYSFASSFNSVTDKNAAFMKYNTCSLYKATCNMQSRGIIMFPNKGVKGEEEKRKREDRKVRRGDGGKF